MAVRYETWSLEALRQEARIRGLSCHLKSNDKAEHRALISLLEPLRISLSSDQKVDNLAIEIQSLTPEQTIEFFGKVIRTLKGRGLLDSTLQNLNSADWMKLYKSVMNIGAGW